MDPLYTKMGIKYQQAYSGHYYDMSISHERSRLICSLKNHVLTGFGRPMISIGPQKELLPKFKKLYYGCSGLWYMDYLESGYLSDIGLFLVKDGMSPSPYYTQMIDLSLDETILHSNIRKGHKCLINKYIPVDVDVKSLHKLHAEVAGKETRHMNTWDIQQKMVDKKEAFCLGTKNAAALFLTSDDTCYYGVAASKNEDTHPIIWHAILRAKEKGLRWFELGHQVFDGDEKLKSIAKFKRGFGGKTVVRMEFKK